VRLSIETSFARQAAAVHDYAWSFDPTHVLIFAAQLATPMLIIGVMGFPASRVRSIVVLSLVVGLLFFLLGSYSFM
jgi:hypothetical protein